MSSQNLAVESSYKKVLITGGNGFVGSHLTEELIQRGFDVRLLLRKTSNLKHLSGLKYESVCGDLLDTESLNNAVENIDYIFHCAGLVKAESETAFIKANRDGTANLLKAALKYSPQLKRFIYISSQAAAGPATELNEHLSEDEIPHPVSDYGKSKLAAEEIVLKHKDEIPITIIRPPAVFGPRDTEVFQFFRSVRLGNMLKFGKKETFYSLVYIEDLVRGILDAARDPAGWGETFFLNSWDCISFWDIQQQMADVMKVTIHPLTLPLPLLKINGKLIESISRIFGQTPFFSLDKAKELSQRYWLSSSEKAKDVLGFKAHLTLEEALTDTYHWYLQQRWL